ncbi:hypothetical protein [Streptomyces sp. NBC_01538]|uniref:hypothetical protein n=1 Tax=Streptomyces sp. NBC_01538 TaxID=2903897 RepID=UPI00386B466F
MTSATDAPSASERRNVSDAAGVVALGACATWSLITAATQGGRPEGVLLSVRTVAAGYATDGSAERYCPSPPPVRRRWPG